MIRDRDPRWPRPIIPGQEGSLPTAFLAVTEGIPTFPPFPPRRALYGKREGSGG